MALIIIIEYGVLPAPKLGYTCKDPRISHKYKGEVITPLMLAIGSLLLPLLALVCTEMLANESFRGVNGSKIWFYYKECATGCMLVLLITEIMKVLIGEHRPHFLDVCEPDTARACNPGEFIEEYTCTNTRYSGYFTVDTSRSFPSGHSSISVFVAVFSAVSTFLYESLKTKRLEATFVYVIATSIGKNSAARVQGCRFLFLLVVLG